MTLFTFLWQGWPVIFTSYLRGEIKSQKLKHEKCQGYFYFIFIFYCCCLFVCFIYKMCKLHFPTLIFKDCSKWLMIKKNQNWFAERQHYQTVGPWKLAWARECHGTFQLAMASIQGGRWLISELPQFLLWWKEKKHKTKLYLSISRNGRHIWEKELFKGTIIKGPLIINLREWLIKVLKL